MKADNTHPGIRIREAPFSSLLLQVVRAHALLATQLLQQIGMVPPQEVVLLYLDDHGPCLQREIVRFMGRDRSTVTNTLQAMERAGLIHREPSGTDRRSLVVSLSRKGRSLVPHVRKTWAEIEKKTVGSLSEERLDDMVQALNQIKAGLASALRGEECDA